MCRFLRRVLDRWVEIVPDDPNWLADIEEDLDCLEPDELWAARNRHK